MWHSFSLRNLFYHCQTNYHNTNRWISWAITKKTSVANLPWSSNSIFSGFKSLIEDEQRKQVNQNIDFLQTVPCKPKFCLNLFTCILSSPDGGPLTRSRSQQHKTRLSSHRNLRLPCGRCETLGPLRSSAWAPNTGRLSSRTRTPDSPPRENRKGPSFHLQNTNPMFDTACVGKCLKT